MFYLFFGECWRVHYCSLILAHCFSVSCCQLFNFILWSFTMFGCRRHIHVIDANKICCGRSRSISCHACLGLMLIWTWTTSSYWIIAGFLASLDHHLASCGYDLAKNAPAIALIAWWLQDCTWSQNAELCLTPLESFTVIWRMLHMLVISFLKQNAFYNGWKVWPSCHKPVPVSAW